MNESHTGMTFVLKVQSQCLIILASYLPQFVGQEIINRFCPGNTTGGNQLTYKIT